MQFEDDAFRAIVDSFSKATGCAVAVLEEGFDDPQPKASVAANTGAGPDMFWALHSTPHLFPAKTLDISDVMGYLGKKYGGWVPLAETYGKVKDKWICMPVTISGNYINYRKFSIEKAGFKEVPADLAAFLALMAALKKNNTAGGFALGHASGDATAWTHWLLWSHGGNLVDKNDKVAINSPETAASLEYCKKLYETFAPGTVAWTRSTTKFPNAVKAFMAYWMEADQYNKWLDGSVGYMTHTLNAYDANPVWTADPRRKVFRDAAKRSTVRAAGRSSPGSYCRCRCRG